MSNPVEKSRRNQSVGTPDASNQSEQARSRNSKNSKAGNFTAHELDSKIFAHTMGGNYGG